MSNNFIRSMSRKKIRGKIKRFSTTFITSYFNNSNPIISFSYLYSFLGGINFIKSCVYSKLNNMLFVKLVLKSISLSLKPSFSNGCINTKELIENLANSINRISNKFHISNCLIVSTLVSCVSSTCSVRSSKRIIRSYLKITSSNLKIANDNERRGWGGL